MLNMLNHASYATQATDATATEARSQRVAYERAGGARNEALPGTNRAQPNKLLREKYRQRCPQQVRKAIENKLHRRHVSPMPVVIDRCRSPHPT